MKIISREFQKPLTELKMKIRKLVNFILNKLITDETKMIILSGPAKGMKWIKGAGNNGHWVGTYEKKKAFTFTRVIKEGDIVFDIGAHVGYYTLIASRVVGEQGRVYAFEPVLRNIEYLRKHIAINKCKNVEIIEAAVSKDNVIAYFDTQKGSYMGKLSNYKTETKVRTLTIDKFVQNKGIVQKVIKIDVEGEEFNVLWGAANTLGIYRPIIFLATHNKGVDAKCRSFLLSLRYRLKLLNSNELIALP